MNRYSGIFTCGGVIWEWSCVASREVVEMRRFDQMCCVQQGSLWLFAGDAAFQLAEPPVLGEPIFAQDLRLTPAASQRGH